jgi:hypothetical protein
VPLEPITPTQPHDLMCPHVHHNYMYMYGSMQQTTKNATSTHIPCTLPRVLRGTPQPMILPLWGALHAQSRLFKMKVCSAKLAFMLALNG